MPIRFGCTFRCDAPGCASQQQVVATLRADEGHFLASIGLGGIRIFEFSYDSASGLEWRTLEQGKVACSKACQETLGLQGKPTPP
jgi:hypothetical protein